MAIISGDFTQRGTPAILDKFTRTKHALLNGVDIVLELPVIYACGSSDVFAYGGVSILDSTNMVDTLCFGSEIGETETFNEISDILLNENDKFKTIFKKEISKGISYPVARCNALERLTGRDLSFLNQPNNILALEYILAIKKISSKIKPMTIRRQGENYNSLSLKECFASASGIRNSIKNNNYDFEKYVPENVYNDLLNVKYKDINYYTNILKYILLNKDISDIADVTEGIENRIIKNAHFNSIDEIIENTKTKRYTYTKISRIISHILLDIKKVDIKKPEYIRVLGFRKEKEYLLKELTKKASLPVIINITKENLPLIEKDIYASKLYNLPDMVNKDLTTPVIKI